MFSICVIGCGGMAVSGHGPGYAHYKREHPDVRLAGCCDLDAQRAQAFAQQFGFEKSYTDYNEMIREQKPDAICLLVNVQYTHPLTMALLPTRIPLITEKPPGLNAQQALEMAEAAEKYGTLNAVAFNRRFTPMLMRFAELYAGMPNRQMIRYDMFRVNRRDLDFATTAIHAIDAVRFVSGADYKSVDFDYLEMPQLGENVANYTLTADMTDGTKAQITLAPVAGILVERAMGIAQEQILFADTPVAGSADGAGELRLYKGNEIVLHEPGDTIPDRDKFYLSAGFYGENAAFFDAVQKGIQPANSLQKAAQSVEIADCLRRRQKHYDR